MGLRSFNFFLNPEIPAVKGLYLWRSTIILISKLPLYATIKTYILLTIVILCKQQDGVHADRFIAKPSTVTITPNVVNGKLRSQLTTPSNQVIVDSAMTICYPDKPNCEISMISWSSAFNRTRPSPDHYINVRPPAVQAMVMSSFDW